MAYSSDPGRSVSELFCNIEVDFGKKAGHIDMREGEEILS